MRDLNDRAEPKTAEGKDKEILIKALYEDRELIFKAFWSRIFPF